MHTIISEYKAIKLVKEHLPKPPPKQILGVEPVYKSNVQKFLHEADKLYSKLTKRKKTTDKYISAYQVVLLDFRADRHMVTGCNKIPFGWIVFWEIINPDNDENISIPGLAPFIVNDEGRMYNTGSGRPLNYYIEDFEKFSKGEPHKVEWREIEQKVIKTQINEEEAMKIAKKVLPKSHFLYIGDWKPVHGLYQGSKITRSQETNFGWLMYWDSIRYLRTKKEEDRLVGNAPIIITFEGKVYFTGLEQSLNYYITDFEKFYNGQKPEYNWENMRYKEE